MKLRFDNAHPLPHTPCPNQLITPGSALTHLRLPHSTHGLRWLETHATELTDIYGTPCFKEGDVRRLAAVLADARRIVGGLPTE